MSVYPDVITSIRATLPIEHSISQAILATEFENGVEQRRLVWDSVRRNIKINYSILEFAYSNSLRRFYETRKGSFHSFSFFFPQIETYVNELVGVATSGSTVLRLPSKKAQSFTLYRNGLPQSPSIWTFVSEGGPDGEDKASLLFIPSIGDIFNFDFTGRLKVKARFEDSPLVFQDIKKYWSSTVVNLVGLEPQL